MKTTPRQRTGKLCIVCQHRPAEWQSTWCRVCDDAVVSSKVLCSFDITVKRTRRFYKEKVVHLVYAEIKRTPAFDSSARAALFALLRKLRAT